MSPSPENPNKDLLLAAVEKLAPLLHRVAFVGGCATGLLVTDPGAAPVRRTFDVDVIIELAATEAAGYGELIKLESLLRQLGFRESLEEGAPRCRWIDNEIILDLMPVDPSILGFSNRWYGPALENAQKTSIGNHRIRLITAPYFLATKLEAFHGRGRNDFRGSHDLEDTLTVIDGRPELVEEVRVAPADLQKYLSGEFGALVSNRDFLDALPGHLLPDSASQQRAGLILARMKQIILQG